MGMTQKNKLTTIFKDVQKCVGGEVQKWPNSQQQPFKGWESAGMVRAWWWWITVGVGFSHKGKKVFYTRLYDLALDPGHFVISFLPSLSKSLSCRHFYRKTPQPNWAALQVTSYHCLLVRTHSKFPGILQVKVMWGPKGESDQPGSWMDASMGRCKQFPLTFWYISRAVSRKARDLEREGCTQRSGVWQAVRDGDSKLTIPWGWPIIRLNPAPPDTPRHAACIGPWRSSLMAVADISLPHIPCWIPQDGDPSGPHPPLNVLICHSSSTPASTLLYHLLPSHSEQMGEKSRPHFHIQPLIIHSKPPERSKIDKQTHWAKL